MDEPREEGDEAGSIALSPVLKRHNAYLVHNETVYCNEEDEWRGDFSCLKVKLHFTRDKAFYWTTVFIPGNYPSISPLNSHLVALC